MNNIELRKEYSVLEGLRNDLNKNIIFIDCMDSVVYREFSLDKLLSMWASQVGRTWGIKSDFLHYYRRQVVAGAMHNTVHINTIYKELAEQCVFYKLLSENDVDKFISDCHSIELNVELQSQHIIDKSKRFLCEQKQLNRRIFCISDFRLPSDDIKLFFKKQGVLSCFEDVFSSCDFGVTKKDGRLYPIIMDRIGANAKDCIMLGDNLKSDCINASINGIQSYWLNNIK